MLPGAHREGRGRDLWALWGSDPALGAARPPLVSPLPAVQLQASSFGPLRRWPLARPARCTPCVPVSTDSRSRFCPVLVVRPWPAQGVSALWSSMLDPGAGACDVEGRKATKRRGPHSPFTPRPVSGHSADTPWGPLCWQGAGQEHARTGPGPSKWLLGPQRLVEARRGKGTRGRPGQGGSWGWSRGRGVAERASASTPSHATVTLVLPHPRDGAAGALSGRGTAGT